MSKTTHFRYWLCVLVLFVFVGLSIAVALQKTWPPWASVEAADNDSNMIPADKVYESVTNSIGMKLILVPAGEFMMGNSLTTDEEIAEFRKYGDNNTADCFAIEYPCHRVRITRPFYMGACHVTRGHFRLFVNETGYKTDAETSDPPGANGLDPKNGNFFGFHKNRSWHNVAFEQTDDHPVVNVSWNDAVVFCRWLSKKEGKIYRLPTEAEWEYSCRAGTTTRYWCGNDPEKLVEIANIADAKAREVFPKGSGPRIRGSDGYVFTSPVGSFRANPFGLFDMHGNVWQWCADRCNGKYYEKSPLDDPVGSDVGSLRTLRGGAWNFTAVDCRSAQRIAYSPTFRDDSIGFRVVLEKGNGAIAR